MLKAVTEGVTTMAPRVSAVAKRGLEVAKNSDIFVRRALSIRVAPPVASFTSLGCLRALARVSPYQVGESRTYASSPAGRLSGKYNFGDAFRQAGIEKGRLYHPKLESLKFSLLDPQADDAVMGHNGQSLTHALRHASENLDCSAENIASGDRTTHHGRMFVATESHPDGPRRYFAKFFSPEMLALAGREAVLSHLSLLLTGPYDAREHHPNTLFDVLDSSSIRCDVPKRLQKGVVVFRAFVKAISLTQVFREDSHLFDKVPDKEIVYHSCLNLLMGDTDWCNLGNTLFADHSRIIKNKCLVPIDSERAFPTEETRRLTRNLSRAPNDLDVFREKSSEFCDLLRTYGADIAKSDEASLYRTFSDSGPGFETPPPGTLKWYREMSHRLGESIWAKFLYNSLHPGILIFSEKGASHDEVFSKKLPRDLLQSMVQNKTQIDMLLIAMGIYKRDALLTGALPHHDTIAFYEALLSRPEDQSIYYGELQGLSQAYCRQCEERGAEASLLV